MSHSPKSILKHEESRPSIANKEVHFGDLTVYKFTSILGDHPTCEGSPLTFGWKNESQSVMSIHVHEYIKQSKPRRKRKDLRLSPAIRDTYLLSEGYSLEQLLQVAETSKLIKEQRRASMKGTSWDRFRKVVDGIKSDGLKLQKKVAGTAA
jgi:hypothetical protein